LKNAFSYIGHLHMVATTAVLQLFLFHFFFAKNKNQEVSVLSNKTFLFLIYQLIRMYFFE